MTTTPPGPPASATGGSITDLDITTEQTSATSARSMAPLTDAVRDASGAAGLGYLVGLVDVNTAMVGLCAVAARLDRHRRPHDPRGRPAGARADDPREPPHPGGVTTDRGGRRHLRRRGVVGHGRAGRPDPAQPGRDRAGDVRARAGVDVERVDHVGPDVDHRRSAVTSSARETCRPSRCCSASA